MNDCMSDDTWNKLVLRLTSVDEDKRLHAALRLSRSPADADRTRAALEPLLTHPLAGSVAAWVMARLPRRDAA